MLVAVCDHPFGTSTSSCLKIVTPFSFPIWAVRFSHSTTSNGEFFPSVKYRSNTSPLEASVLVAFFTVSTALPSNADFTVAIPFLPATGPLFESEEPLVIHLVAQGAAFHSCLRLLIFWLRESFPPRNYRKQ